MNVLQREIRLMPHILGMERRGLTLDIPLLRHDTDKYAKVLAMLDGEIQMILRRKVDIDSNTDLADAIEAAGFSRGFASTPKGHRSVAQESLLGAITHPTLLGHLLCRGAIATCVRTFYRPWLAQAEAHGKLYVKWNQFRNYTDTGARTGRLSSSPNLQNIPVTWEKLKKQLAKVGYTDHSVRFSLPLMRQYIVARPGHILIGRDYKAQEMRLLAHFTDGILLSTIRANPDADIHDIAAKLASISRTEAKTLAFAIIYGAGVGRLAESLDIPVSTASAIKARYLARLPEIKQFTKSLTNLADNGLPITTLAGRQYYCQAPAVMEGRFKTFDYKLANYKIQGSAADQTKEAMYDYATKSKYGVLLLSVHDQLVVEVPEDRLEEERVVLEHAMNGAFQETLKYKVVSDESYGMSFHSLKI